MKTKVKDENGKYKKLRVGSVVTLTRQYSNPIPHQSMFAQTVAFFHPSQEDISPSDSILELYKKLINSVDHGYKTVVYIQPEVEPLVFLGAEKRQPSGTEYIVKLLSPNKGVLLRPFSELEIKRMFTFVC